MQRDALRTVSTGQPNLSCFNVCKHEQDISFQGKSRVGKANSGRISDSYSSTLENGNTYDTLLLNLSLNFNTYQQYPVSLNLNLNFYYL
jgi:hypothetical protein